MNYFYKESRSKKKNEEVNVFNKESKTQKKIFSFGGGGGGGGVEVGGEGGGARVSEFFVTKNPNLK